MDIIVKIDDFLQDGDEVFLVAKVLVAGAGRGMVISSTMPLDFSRTFAQNKSSMLDKMRADIEFAIGRVIPANARIMVI